MFKDDSLRWKNVDKETVTDVFCFREQYCINDKEAAVLDNRYIVYTVLLIKVQKTSSICRPYFIKLIKVQNKRRICGPYY